MSLKILFSETTASGMLIFTPKLVYIIKNQNFKIVIPGLKHWPKEGFKVKQENTWGIFFNHPLKN